MKPMKNVLVSLQKKYDIFKLKRNLDDVIPDTVIQAKAHFAADIWRVKCIHLGEVKKRKQGTSNPVLMELMKFLLVPAGKGSSGDGSGGIATAGDSSSRFDAEADRVEAAADEDVPRGADGLPDFGIYEPVDEAEADSDVDMHIASQPETLATPQRKTKSFAAARVTL